MSAYFLRGPGCCLGYLTTLWPPKNFMYNRERFKRLAEVFGKLCFLHFESSLLPLYQAPHGYLGRKGGNASLLCRWQPAVSFLQGEVS